MTGRICAAGRRRRSENLMENLIFSINATLPIFLLMVLGYVLSS